MSHPRGQILNLIFFTFNQKKSIEKRKKRPSAHPPARTIKILRIFLIVGHPRDPKGENHGFLTTFRGINEPKSGPSKYENNAQTLPKQLQNNFEKGQKMTFLAQELAKITISGVKFWPKILIFGVIY